MLQKSVAHLPLSAIERDRLDSLAEELICRNNEVIFTERDNARYVYFLSSGLVRRHRTLRDGRRHIVGFALPGDFLVAPQSNHKSFAADAIGEVAVKRFARSRFFEFAQLSPPLMKLILDFTLAELQLAQDKLVLLRRRTPEERLLAFLLMWQRKLARWAPDTTDIILPMKRHDIADYIGTTFETVSRIFTRLQQEQLIIVMPQRVRLVDPTRAATLVGFAHLR
ncbi:MAG: helix-turn-helix domain-containing protein [Rhodopseudomonas sp.]|uniref:Crp/Fnr family transcriptional regulator n=1 Tax=Rhodopseudomonas sp. TaxID=1078 RepID=UPI0017A859D6|nr:helix-turn-helix domain-containing protein [Rhodopseudomonas sp.]NVN88675.1 helix-turn-helix domain-containing protein [Rhodopseudomonas sp.]